MVRRHTIAKSALRYGNADVAEFQDAGVVTLDVERPRLAFVGIQRAAGNALDLLLINCGDAVADHGQCATHQRNIERLPHAGRARKLNIRRDPAVYRPNPALHRSCTERSIFELDFITTPQVEAAIAFVGAVDLEVQLEVVELAGRLQVRTAIFIDQHPIFHNPVAVG